jgi:hypothetical protein
LLFGMFQLLRSAFVSTLRFRPVRHKNAASAKNAERMLAQ